MEDRLMTLKELAAYLNINERTALKLVSEGPLPAVKVGNQWRFRKAMVDAWLDDQMLGLSNRYLDFAGKPSERSLLLDLEACFRPEHIVPELEAQGKAEVVEELAAHAHRLGVVRNKNWFVGALIERENIMPTATGNGVAFLHTLRRHPDQIVRPFMVLGRSRQGVDFSALDGRPTHLFFVLGLKFTELHLPWLTKLAQMLARPDPLKALLTAPDIGAMYEVLSEAERRLKLVPAGTTP